MPFREDPQARRSRLEERLSRLRTELARARAYEEEARLLERELASEARRISLPLLDGLRIASPCTEPWDTMEGGDRVRRCQRCRKDVYDLSALTRVEAEQLLLATEGQICARLYRRKDGTILTSDCSIGSRRTRLKRGFLGTLVAAALAALGLGTRGVSEPPPAGTAGTQKPRKHVGPLREINLLELVEEEGVVSLGEIAHSIEKMDEAKWNRLVADRPDRK